MTFAFSHPELKLDDSAAFQPNYTIPLCKTYLCNTLYQPLGRNRRYDIELLYHTSSFPTMSASLDARQVSFTNDGGKIGIQASQYIVKGDNIVQ